MNFSVSLDVRTRRALEKLARHQERKRGDVVRRLIIEASRSLDNPHGEIMTSTGASGKDAKPAVESDHATAQAVEVNGERQAA